MRDGYFAGSQRDNAAAGLDDASPGRRLDQPPQGKRWGGGDRPQVGHPVQEPREALVDGRRDENEADVELCQRLALIVRLASVRGHQGRDSSVKGMLRGRHRRQVCVAKRRAKPALERVADAPARRAQHQRRQPRARCEGHRASTGSRRAAVGATGR